MDMNHLRVELVKAALTGILSSPGRISYSQAAREAVLVADLTLRELGKGTNGGAFEAACPPPRALESGSHAIA